MKKDDIECLLDALDAMFPISPVFRAHLRKLMRPRKAKNGKILLQGGKIAKKAWQLLDGHLVGFKKDKNGNENICFIYYPGEIITDMPSFFEGHLVQFSIRCVGEVSLLELKKKDFEELNVYKETEKLVQHLMMRREQIAIDRGDLLRLPVPLRVEKFVTSNPVLNLPAEYAASFLSIGENEYIAYSLPHFKIMLLKDAAPVSRILFKQPNVIAHEARLYILEHFANEDIGNTDVIAEKLYTTRKTLTRAFKKLFNTTIYGMIVSMLMQKAYKLLKEEKMEVNIVSLAVGYKDVSSFSRIFKHYFGYSPRNLNNL